MMRDEHRLKRKREGEHSFFIDGVTFVQTVSNKSIDDDTTIINHLLNRLDSFRGSTISSGRFDLFFFEIKLFLSMQFNIPQRSNQCRRTRTFLFIEFESKRRSSSTILFDNSTVSRRKLFDEHSLSWSLHNVELSRIVVDHKRQINPNLRRPFQ